MRLPFIAVFVLVAGTQVQAQGIFDNPAESFWRAYGQAAGISVDGTMLLFGGKNNSVFLGCFDCSEYDGESIHNTYGPHGSQYESESIFNQYGEFGGPYSDYSPCNPYSDEGPVLVGTGGEFYGRLTTNPYATDAINDGRVKAWLAGICR